MDSGFGSANMAIPAQVLVLGRGCPVRVVWTNGVDGVTCEYGHGDAPAVREMGHFGRCQPRRVILNTG